MDWDLEPKIKKAYPFRRWCKARASQECLIIFRSSHRRNKVCPKCEQHIKLLKLNKKRYLQMTDKPVYEETAKWLNEEECELTWNEDDLVKDSKGNVIAHRKSNTTAKTNREDMEYNIRLKEQLIEKARKEIEDNNSKLEKYGKKPVLTAGQIRLRQDLATIDRHEQITQLEQKNSNNREEIERNQDFIRIRLKTLSTAPKKGTADSEAKK